MVNNSDSNSALFKSIIISCLLCLLSSNLFATETAVATNIQADNSNKVTLTFFWSRYCKHCKAAKPFINQLQRKYSWLTVHSYDLVGNPEKQLQYQKMATQLQQNANSVPAFIFCKQMMLGYGKAETTGRELEKKLLACHNKQNGKPDRAQENFYIPSFGYLHYQKFSLPVFTLIIAALDAFNPCAFFILFFLLSLLVHHRSRLHMLVIGGTFVLCSGLMYFLFMSAWLNLFLLTEQLVIITAVAGLIAICFGLLNIKDFFFFKKGVSLSIPDSARDKLFARIRKLTQSGNWPTMIAATIVLAIAVNSYELLCTAGLPMVYTRILTLNELSNSQYYLYLAFYNIIYIVPLLLIVILFAVTLGRKKLSEQEGRLLKLLSGSMMLGLGLILFLKPEWLNNMLVSVGVIMGSIVLTALVALLQKLKY